MEDYEKLLKNIREAEKQSGKHIAVLGDLSGPKIRVGKVIDGTEVINEIKQGDEIEKIVITEL